MIFIYGSWDSNMCCAELVTFGGHLECILMFASQIFSMLGYGVHEH
jgi:hypothetical protein